MVGNPAWKIFRREIRPGIAAPDTFFGFRLVAGAGRRHPLPIVNGEAEENLEILRQVGETAEVKREEVRTRRKAGKSE